jgi:hypothetical protein
MDVLSRQRRSKVGISPQFRFAIQFEEDNQTRSVEVLARTKKKALSIFRKHYPSDNIKVLRVFSPKERKRYAADNQKTFATEEAARIAKSCFSPAESVQ